MNTVPIAPVGPSPLCNYPRGHLTGTSWTERHVDPDWLLLHGYWGIARVCALVMKRHAPSTWRDAVALLVLLVASEAPGSPNAEARYLSQIEACGLDPDSAPPANLAALAAACEEWAFAKGRFADGQLYRMPRRPDLSVEPNRGVGPGKAEKEGAA